MDLDVLYSIVAPLNDQTFWLFIRSIAVAEERTTDVLIDGKQVEIAEEYANGGITELHSKGIRARRSIG